MTTRLFQTRFRVLVMLALALAVVTPALAYAPTPIKTTASYEVGFMQDMIDHHKIEVASAEICLEKAIREELVKLCQSIIDIQKQEMMMLQTWLQELYGVSYEPEINLNLVDRFDSIKGGEFEIEFMQTTVKQHRQAIKESEQCVNRSNRSELQILSQNIIAVQRQEMQLLKTWLCDWYGMCSYYL